MVNKTNGFIIDKLECSNLLKLLKRTVLGDKFIITQEETDFN